jgi:hypothetical protein
MNEFLGTSLGWCVFVEGFVSAVGYSIERLAGCG